MNKGTLYSSAKLLFEVSISVSRSDVVFNIFCSTHTTLQCYLILVTLMKTLAIRAAIQAYGANYYHVPLLTTNVTSHSHTSFPLKGLYRIVHNIVETHSLPLVEWRAVSDGYLLRAFFDWSPSNNRTKLLTSRPTLFVIRTLLTLFDLSI